MTDAGVVEEEFAEEPPICSVATGAMLIFSLLASELVVEVGDVLGSAAIE